MGSLKGTKTEHNLLASFAGESQARNRYTYAAKVAKKNGYEQISAFFLETAENERQHAKSFFKFLEGGNVEITAAYPAGVIGDTVSNLEAAVEGENEEWSVLYPNAAKVADEEGFPEVAKKFRAIAKVEQAHEARYKRLLDNINTGKVFKKETTVKWKCLKCGYIHSGEKAVDKCPSCDHPQAYFEMFVENY